VSGMATRMPEPSVLLPAAAGRESHRYRRPPERLCFPVSEEVPETKDNLERRTALYTSLRRSLAAEVTIGSDQFVYYDPTSSKKRLAPDVFVRLGAPDTSFDVWFTWERGAPDLGVEIISASDKPWLAWDDKLMRYRAAGIREVVAFDATDWRMPIHVWDFVDGDMVERSPDDPNLRRCEALKLWWVVVRDPEFGPMLRLARDREGCDLLPTSCEVEAKAREDEARAREGEAKAREGEARACEAAARERAAKERLEAEVAALRARIGGAQEQPRKRRPR